MNSKHNRLPTLDAIASPGLYIVECRGSMRRYRADSEEHAIARFVSDNEPSYATHHDIAVSCVKQPVHSN